MKRIFISLVLSLLCLSQLSAQDAEYLPLVREGVIWVNEKVIVDHGDTTSYYYIYEISGIYTGPNDSMDTYQACYYYTGESLDVEKDSLISGLRVYPNGSVTKEGYTVRCIRNEAYQKIIKEETEKDSAIFLLHMPMYMDGSRVLYEFGIGITGDISSDISSMICFYNWLEQVNEVNGFDVFLTPDNFIEVDSVEIEGYKCSRCVYLGEDGEPQAYVVEGIGFDSRDMGDMLTPFMRPPTPRPSIRNGAA